VPAIAINGTELHFFEHGSGWPCLVMHGGLGFDHSYLTPGLDTLGDTLRLIYYDHRCNGRSGRPPIETLTFEQLADDADALRIRLGYESVCIIAHSITGSAIALEYALRHPGHLRHLILVCAAPGFDPTDQAFGERLARKGMTPEMAEAFAHAGDSDSALRHYIETAGPLYYHAFDNQRHRRMFGRMLYHAAATVRSFELLATWNILDRLGAVLAPTLVITGDSDPFSPPAGSATLRDGIPDADLVILGESGHFPWVDQPEEFAAAIRNWLSAGSRGAW
jgi:proline iminopeptidase